MNPKIVRIVGLVAFLVIVFTGGAAAQAADQPVAVKLSLADGKRVYKIGETILLNLSFSTYRTGYSVVMGVDPIDTVQDEVTVSPNTGVFDWKKFSMRGRRYTSDGVALQQLSAEPVIINLPLNYFVRFDSAGKYTVRIKTRRAGTRAHTDGEREPPLELITNEVGFEIHRMTAAEEAAEVARLGAALDQAVEWQEQTRLANQLANLAGDGAIAEKVKRYFISQTNGNYFGAINRGLTVSRNQPLVIKMLESAFRDPARPVNFQLLGTLTGLKARLNTQAQGTKSMPDGMHFDNDHESKHVREVYLREIVDSLPNRRGASLTAAAITVLQSLPRQDAPAETVARVRTILLKHFDDLDIFTREHIINVYWDQLRDPSLIPSIERMLRAKDYPSYGIHNVHTTALKRLIELDRERARPFVIAEIQNPDSLVDVEFIGALPDKFLPETDEALLRQISKFSEIEADRFNFVRLRAKTMIAARFATSAIYDRLLDVYTENSGGWQADAKGLLLGYFARHNAGEALKLIEKELAAAENGQEFTLLYEFTRVDAPQEVMNYLRKRLMSSDPQIAENAAYLISRHAVARDRERIESRLKQWLTQWGDRPFELEGPQMKAGDERQAMLQVVLIQSLTQAKAWTLSDAEIKELKAKCLTQLCRQHFPTIARNDLLR
jgi:hypothetical protein